MRNNNTSEINKAYSIFETTAKEKAIAMYFPDIVRENLEKKINSGLTAKKAVAQLYKEVSQHYSIKF